MDQIRFARGAHLSAMFASRKDVGFLQKLLVEIGFVRLDSVEDVFEADHRRFRNRVLMLTVPVWSGGLYPAVGGLNAAAPTLRHLSCSPRSPDGDPVGAACKEGGIRVEAFRP